jgi:pimeloyl-ACP methyl ester carboxylesterase
MCRLSGEVPLPSGTGKTMSEISAARPSSKPIEVLSDSGSGRTFITIVDDEAYLPFARAVVEKLATKARSVLLMSSAVTATSWEALSEAFSATLADLNVRQASIVGMGAGAALAQNLALSQPKTVRSLAIVDSSSRPHPSRWERLVDWIEEHLPFGLPLRLGSRGFNVKAYVHRLRCPLLVIVTSRASSFIREELKSLASRAPTAWRVVLSGPLDSQISELSDTLLNFQDTPAKCPQKNVKE